jgi:hypothetical protein
LSSNRRDPAKKKYTDLYAHFALALFPLDYWTAGTIPAGDETPPMVASTGAPQRRSRLWSYSQI